MDLPGVGIPGITEGSTFISEYSSTAFIFLTNPSELIIYLAYKIV
jgi:hypothetical protein